MLDFKLKKSNFAQSALFQFKLNEITRSLRRHQGFVEFLNSQYSTLVLRKHSTRIFHLIILIFHPITGLHHYGESHFYFFTWFSRVIVHLHRYRSISLTTRLYKRRHFLRSSQWIQLKFLWNRELFCFIKYFF